MDWLSSVENNFFNLLNVNILRNERNTIIIVPIQL